MIMLNKPGMAVPTFKRNIYYTIGLAGLLLNLVVTFALPFLVDPYFAAIFNVFYPVWIMILVIGWRKAHPRR